jgi:NTE family protein
MTQKPFSLILGGGAARGLAHIGVIRRLEELQITPSLIVGTSMGALIGAFYVCGYTSQDIEKIASDISLVKLLDIDLKK